MSLFNLVFLAIGLICRLTVVLECHTRIFKGKIVSNVCNILLNFKGSLKNKVFLLYMVPSITVNTHLNDVICSHHFL